jgi:glucose-1-phosphate cytidylyltransferase
MKVVLFCGGLGTRLREHAGTLPKPLVPIGSRPIIWYLMKYYAHFGHKDFVLCLGFKGDSIRNYFLTYNPNVSRDFTIERGGAITPKESDISDWRITLVDTGLHSNIGQRLLKVRQHLEGEEAFLANYSDQVSNLPMPEYLEFFRKTGATASFVAVRPSQSFHSVTVRDGGRVDSIQSMQGADFWINGGYMILKQGIFDVMQDGEELVAEPFQRLAAAGKLFAYRYEGFWASMDTFKDKIMFERMNGRGERPWSVWEK